MADTVLESFLIKLGYQVDQASQKTFTSAIAEGAAGVMKFTAALGAMAIGVEEAVRRASYQMARLEHSAQLSGQAGDTLKAWGTSIQAIGGSYEGLIKSQEQLNQLIVKSPWLKEYGEQALGGMSLNMKNIIQHYHDLSARFGESSQEVLLFRQQMEDLMHVDMSFAIQANKNWKGYQEAQKLAEAEAARFHKRFEEAAKNSLEVQLKFTELTNTLDNYYKTALGGFEGILAKTFGQIEDWFVSHEDDFIHWMDDLDKKFDQHDWSGIGEKIGEAVGAGVNYILDHAQEWIDAGLQIGMKFVEGFVKGLIKGLLGADVAAAFQSFDDQASYYLNKLAGVKQDPEVEKRVKALEQSTPAVPQSDWYKYAGPQDEGDPGSWHFGKRGQYQHGGIVPINAHPGEMVLPKVISDGLQSFYGGGGDDNSSALSDLGRWLNGDTAFTPIVGLADSVYDQLSTLFDTVLGKGGGAGGGGGGGGGGDGQGGGGGGDGQGGGSHAPGEGQPDMPSGATRQSYAESRKQFAEELKNNPQLREKVLAISAGENTNPEANRAVLETMMNRAEMMHKTLAQTALLYGKEKGGYYAGYSPSNLAQNRQMYEANLAAVLGGSDVSHGATDNASAWLARKRISNDEMKLMFQAGGESFFAPGGRNSVAGAGTLRQAAEFAARHSDAEIPGTVATNLPATGPGGSAGLPMGNPNAPSIGGQNVSNITTGGDPRDKMSDIVDQLLKSQGVNVSSPMLRKIVKDGSGLDPYSNAWCAMLVNTMLKAEKEPKARSNFASDFLRWGKGVDLEHMMKGDVGVALHGAAVGGPGDHAVVMTGRRAMRNHQQMVETIGREGNEIRRRWRAASDLAFRRASDRDGTARVDNSTNTTVIQGVTDAEGVRRHLYNKDTANSMHHHRTMVS